MTAQPVRTQYSNGAVLDADDLNADAVYHRDQLARHQHGLHTPGIAEGLQIISTDTTAPSGAPAKKLRLTSGMAIDGFGREIVVPADVPLNEMMVSTSSLTQDPNVAAKWSAPCPLFLFASDQPVAGDSLGMTRCGGSRTTRQSEGYQLEFGLPGDEIELVDQPSATASTSLSSDPGAWRVLLGFVRIDLDDLVFIAVTDSSNGVGVAYAGVLADELVARSSRLVLRAGGAKPAAGQLMVELDNTTGLLRYGPSNAHGSLDHALLTIDKEGNVQAQGVVHPGMVAGTTWMESGTISPGMVIPLPAGVPAAKVVDGTVVLHITLTPRIVDHIQGDTIAEFTCDVDGERRVSVEVKDASGVRLPACDYLIVAAVPAPALAGTTP